METEVKSELQQAKDALLSSKAEAIIEMQYQHAAQLLFLTTEKSVMEHMLTKIDSMETLQAIVKLTSSDYGKYLLRSMITLGLREGGRHMNPEDDAHAKLEKVMSLISESGLIHGVLEV